MYLIFKFCSAFSIYSGNPLSSGSFLLASLRQKVTWLTTPCLAAMVVTTSVNCFIYWATTSSSPTKFDFHIVKVGGMRWVGYCFKFLSFPPLVLDIIPVPYLDYSCID